MTNKDLISQYVDTGIGIPKYQFDKLSNNDKRTYLRKMEIAIERVPDNIKYYYGDLPEANQLALINKGAFWIQYMNNPTEKTQLAAVNRAAQVIIHIDNPSEAVQLAAINKDKDIVWLIKNPTEKVQLVAVMLDAHFLDSFVRNGINPSHEVQLAAVKNNGYTIRYIEHPSEEVQLAAVKANYRAIGSIKNPTQKVKELYNQLYNIANDK